jgi:ubiquitin C-terminal hydrolase
MTEFYSHCVGLINFGNTCFMNASIQLLMSAPVLGAFILFCDTHLNSSELNSYVQTWKDYNNLDNKILGPRMLYYRYMMLNKNYVGFSQEDSHEFLTFTLDDILNQIKKNINDSNLIENNKNDVIEEINKIFRIKFNQIVHYTDPNHPEFNKPSNSEVYENILNLSINENTKTLEDCLKLYYYQEENDFKIEYSIINKPKYLFVCLKRFKFDGSSLSKNVTSIDIPFETNIFQLNKTYKLCGFIIHVGGLFGGHYYAYGLRNGKWYCFNDANVSETKIDDVINESKNAYILLYM